MILYSTMKRLQDSNGRVYAVETAAWTIKRAAVSNDALGPYPVEDREMPAHCELFAKEDAALRKAAEYSELNRAIGGPDAVVRKARAIDFDALTLEPKK